MRKSKYQPLEKHLLSLRFSRWEASFDEIEKILGFQLPKSANTHPEWWANENPDVTTHSHCKAWVCVGWKTENVNLTNQKLVFFKVAQE